MADLTKIEAWLERKGWTRRIAGETDFSAALAAIETALDHRLGLVIAGEYGSGKTLLASAFAASLGHYRKIRCGIVEDLRMLKREWMEDHAENLFERVLMIDDVGAEHPENVYGVKVEPILEFLTRWSELKGENAVLIITTNLSSAELDERYGGRFYSRLKDACVPLKLLGADKRRWKLPVTR